MSCKILVSPTMIVHVQKYVVTLVSRRCAVHRGTLLPGAWNMNLRWSPYHWEDHNNSRENENQDMTWSIQLCTLCDQQQSTLIETCTYQYSCLYVLAAMKYILAQCLAPLTNQLDYKTYGYSAVHVSDSLSHVWSSRKMYEGTKDIRIPGWESMMTPTRHASLFGLCVR